MAFANVIVVISCAMMSVWSQQRSIAVHVRTYVRRAKLVLAAIAFAGKFYVTSLKLA